MILLFLLGCPRTVAPPAAPEADEPVALDDATLVAWRDALVPLLEKHAERSFTAVPEVRWLTAEAFGAIAQEEAELITGIVYADTPPEVREARAKVEGEVSVRGLFGKYGLFTDEVYVVRESIEDAAEAGHGSVEDLGRIVLVHELAHALQDQQSDSVEVLHTLTDQDHFHGWSAVSEGGANHLARKVADELGLTPTFWSLSTLQGWSEDGLDEPAAYDVWMRYGRGMAMLDEVATTGGMDAFWTWHTAPPASSSMIFRPSTYAPSVPERPFDYAAVLRGTDQLLTRGNWMVSNTRLGEYVLRGEAIRTGKETELDAVLQHLVGAQILDLTRPDRAGNIRYLQFDRPEAARSYLQLLRAEQTIEGLHLAETLGVTVEVSYGEVRDVEGDASLLRTQRVPAGNGRFIETRTAWVVRGADVVAVTAERFRPGLRLATTVQGVFDNLTEVRGRP